MNPSNNEIPEHHCCQIIQEGGGGGGGNGHPRNAFSLVGHAICLSCLSV